MFYDHDILGSGYNTIPHVYMWSRRTISKVFVDVVVVDVVSGFIKVFLPLDVPLYDKGMYFAAQKKCSR